MPFLCLTPVRSICSVQLLVASIENSTPWSRTENCLCIASKMDYGTSGGVTIIVLNGHD